MWPVAMCVAMILVLVVALALRTHCQHTPLSQDTDVTTTPTTHANTSLCEDSPFINIIYYDMRDENDRRRNGWTNTEKQISIPYGSSVKVYCIHDTKVDNLIMTRNGEKLATSKTYKNAIESTKKQDLSTTEDVFVCTDIESNCTSFTTVLITPGINVISDNVQLFLDNYNTNYTVLYEKPMTVLCSGFDAARLVLSHDRETLLAERENHTTIRHFVNKTKHLISTYVCTDIYTHYNSSVNVKVMPAVYVKTRNKFVTPIYGYQGEQFHDLLYRNDSVEVCCSGPRAIKFTGHSEEDTSLTDKINVNPHSAKYINKFKLGSWYFDCSDSEFHEYTTSAVVTTIPQMEITTPNVRRVGSRKYRIKYDDTIEIICSGTYSDELKIFYVVVEDPFGVSLSYENKGTQLTLNNTSIKYILKAPGMDKYFKFHCYKEKSTYSKASLAVEVLPADVTDFRCVSHNGQLLNCTWTNSSNKVNFTLSLVENGILTRICETLRSSRKSRVCILDYEFNSKQAEIKEFVLLLQSCNSFSCYNQTFHIDHLSVMKPDAPWSLNVRKTKPRNAVLSWHSDIIHAAGEYLEAMQNDYHYKLFWYSAIGQREVHINSSMITYSYSGCEIELQLPCPGQFYEVWLYQKLRRTVGEEYWSEPASVIFQTDNDITFDPSCSWKPRKTAAVMEYFVQEYRQDVHIEMQTLKEKVSALKDKMAMIRAYIEEQGKDTV